MIRVQHSPDDPGGEGSGLSFSADVRKNDGNIEITVSADMMTATAVLYPPIGDGAPLTPDYAAELLARMGISYGLLWDELSERILDANADRRIIRDVVVARGAPPVSEHPEHVVVDGRFLPGFRPVSEDEHTVDWKAISQVLVVKKGEAIGRVIARREGANGSDVTGKPIAFGKDQVTSYSLGKNVERVGDDILALSDGRVTLDGQRISVEEVLVIKGDVDYRVGHIMFPGDVVIEGCVAAGFKVYSGGSITIKETMDAFDVSAKRDLVCAQGIIGKDLGQVRVGGSLKAKFIENARVAVRGDAEVPGSIVGSSLYTLGRLSMGDKGRIVGGEVFATHGVSCGFLGGGTKPVTVVNVGIDFTVQQKLEQANAALRTMTVRLTRLQNVRKLRPGDESLAKAVEEAQAKVKSLTDNVADLARRVDIDEDAAVEVKGLVYPGVIVTICHIRVNVDEPLKKARFRLDRAANKIVIER
ncbi:MAG: DUF342 domain-containing protein [Spirochaetaceae bacterium]|nr:DUF342 domain-containing protein [Spirochaetaceae bacterium]HPE89945.1 FapA family protein [Spirochaetales bacterium]